MRPNDVIRLRHMIEAAETIARFLAGRRREDLDAGAALNFATVRTIETFGEAASCLSPEARRVMPGLPWAAIIAMRDRPIHAYLDIDHDIVWTTAIAEIPAPTANASASRWTSCERAFVEREERAAVKVGSVRMDAVRIRRALARRRLAGPPRPPSSRSRRPLAPRRHARCTHPVARKTSSTEAAPSRFT